MIQLELDAYIGIKMCFNLESVKHKSNRKAMHRNWGNQKANPAPLLKPKQEINKNASLYAINLSDIVTIVPKLRSYVMF